eukprot:maker-scaffold_22-snap-gene-1.46-mRNA-1 protein AED:0.07 eAED:0.07 QI:350/0.66/0.5/1/1/1/4/0/410
MSSDKFHENPITKYKMYSRLNKILTNSSSAKLFVFASTTFGISLASYSYTLNPTQLEFNETKLISQTLPSPKFFTSKTDQEGNFSFKHYYENFLREQQKKITQSIGNLEISSNNFLLDSWDRESGGGGVSGILQGGKTFEKAGVNISIVNGKLPPAAIQQMRSNHSELENIEKGKTLDFFAAGLSLVIHPVNPHVPTVHLNYRYFEIEDKEKNKKYWWFGGGSDLTPSYLYEEDCANFHQTLKNACDKHDDPKNQGNLFEKYKKWCDDYFTNTHRGEKRGIGGIFFDDLSELATFEKEDEEVEKLIKIQKFQEDCLSAFLEIEKRMKQEYGEEEKKWQQLRRGRYVEFNLVHDRGTKFGLYAPNPRVESILMSLPLTARWEYMHKIKPGSQEEKMMEVLKKPVDWINYMN